jgi:hypothetical protein
VRNLQLRPDAGHTEQEITCASRPAIEATTTQI